MWRAPPRCGRTAPQWPPAAGPCPRSGWPGRGQLLLQRWWWCQTAGCRRRRCHLPGWTPSAVTSATPGAASGTPAQWCPPPAGGVISGKGGASVPELLKRAMCNHAGRMVQSAWRRACETYSALGRCTLGGAWCCLCDEGARQGHLSGTASTRAFDAPRARLGARGARGQRGSHFGSGWARWVAGRSPTTRGDQEQWCRPASLRLRARHPAPRRTAATPPWRRPGRCSPRGGLSRAAPTSKGAVSEGVRSLFALFALWAALPDAAQRVDESDHTRYTPGSNTRWVCVATRGAAPCAGARPLRGGATLTPPPRPWTPRRGVTTV